MSTTEAARKEAQVPDPVPVSSDYLVGCHYFPGWGIPQNWQCLEMYPERTPLLSYYDERNPEVADWEIKWALEHGIQFWVYCWYRKQENVGKPVDYDGLFYAHEIHEGLFRCRHGEQMKFAIMWETSNAGAVSDPADLENHLFPFWVENYFRRPNYLTVDGKPVLFLYWYDSLMARFGGPSGLRDTLNRMRDLAVRAGFPGILLPGEYRAGNPDDLRRMAEATLDWHFIYCMPSYQQRPTAEQVIAAQDHKLRFFRDADLLPLIPCASAAWDPMPWNSPQPDTPYHADRLQRWKLMPQDWRTVLGNVKTFMDEMPEDQPGRRMLILDNWNEWGEGHYISPHVEGGFGYLKAVRDVFTRCDNEPDYRTPEELGMGPYDGPYRKWVEEERRRAKPAGERS